ncbi:MAG: beta-lactamase family protein [Flavobacteriaceae bacterium]|nr:beta-lactamase family protein [Flavobacteriaceae bacterium]
MKKLIFLLSASLLLTISCTNNSKTSSNTALQIFADSLFQSSLDSSMIAGGAIIAFQKNKMLLNKWYGHASLELSTEMPENGVFEIGSVTKQFTAAAILQLVEAKKLALDDDFTSYIPYNTKGRKITIDNLLNHTSGIPSYTEVQEFWDLSIEQHPRDSLVRLMESKDFLFEPGEALIYNNTGYFILGLIIEKVAGQSYEDYLKEHVFDPLGMQNTSYCSSNKVIKNKVYGYNYSPKGLEQKGFLEHIWPYAAGSLCSTTSDMLIWLKALHTQNILPKALYQSIITPGTLNDGSPLRYAKGLTNYSNYGNHMIGHGGGIHGFLSETRYFPDKDLYIICLINTTGPHGGGFFANQITWKLLDKIQAKGVEIGMNTKDFDGDYSGAARGRTLNVTIKSVSDGFTMQRKGRKRIDTINTYVGSSTWRKGNQLFTFKNKQFHIDQTSGHYVLKKKK